MAMGRRNVDAQALNASRAGTIFIALFSLTSAPATATEGGATNKALGVDTVLAGVMGSPGSVRNTNFLAYYHADQTLDGSGRPRAGLSSFDLDVSAATSRFQFVWPEAKLFGADIETRVGATWYADADVKFDVQTPGGIVQRQSASSGWFPGALVGPVILGWHGQTVHQMTGIEIYFPTSSYVPGQPANVSTGFVSVAPHYWITWFPNADVEVDGSFVYLFNQKNQKSDYRSGQEFSMDYAAGYSPTPNWQAGASGFLYKQTTDDKVNDSAVPGGNRGRAFGIGPYVRFHEGYWGVTFKWQNELWVENRAKGNRYFIQFAFALK
jgi:hypothetical protein